MRRTEVKFGGGGGGGGGAGVGRETKGRRRGREVEKDYYEQRDYGFLSARVWILCLDNMHGPHIHFVDQYGLGAKVYLVRVLCTVGSIWKVCTCVAKCIVLHCVQWLSVSLV